MAEAKKTSQDRFTTDYFLPDDSYGSIITGNYTTLTGDHANLITGDFELANGQTGNIYQGDTIAEPNTSTLVLPTPYTSSGVGSAIPASVVGSPLSFMSSSLPLPTLPTTPSVGSSSTILSTQNATTSIESPTTGSSVASTTSAVPTNPEITPPTTKSGATHVTGGKTDWLWAVVFSAACFTLMMR